MGISDWADNSLIWGDSERVRVVFAHVCPVVNLTDELTIFREGVVLDKWRVAARGKVQ